MILSFFNLKSNFCVRSAIKGLGKCKMKTTWKSAEITKLPSSSLTWIEYSLIFKWKFMKTSPGNSARTRGVLASVCSAWSSIGVAVRSPTFFLVALLRDLALHVNFVFLHQLMPNTVTDLRRKTQTPPEEFTRWMPVQGRTDHTTVTHLLSQTSKLLLGHWEET